MLTKGAGPYELLAPIMPRPGHKIAVYADAGTLYTDVTANEIEPGSVRGKALTDMGWVIDAEMGVWSLSERTVH